MSDFEAVKENSPKKKKKKLKQGKMQHNLKDINNNETDMKTLTKSDATNVIDEDNNDSVEIESLHVSHESIGEEDKKTLMQNNSLPGNKFMKFNEISKKMEESQSPSENVPKGTKENVFFVVKNQKGASCIDDCGAWLKPFFKN